MKRAKVIIWIVCLLAVVCVACGKTTQEPPAPPAPTPAPVYGAYTVDASLEEWSNSTLQTAVSIPVQDGQSASVCAVKTQEGMLVSVTARHFRYVTTSENVLANANVQFTLGASDTVRYAVATGESQGVTAFEAKSVIDGAMRTTVFEIFVARELVSSFDDMRLGVSVHMSGYGEDYFWGYGAGWTADGLALRSADVRVGEQGLVRVRATDDTVLLDANGQDAQWQDTVSLSSAYHDGQMTVNGFCGADGVYLLLTATHKEVNTHQYWCYNPNFELRIGLSSGHYRTVRIVRYDETTTLTSLCAQAVMHTVYDEAIRSYRTLCEAFVPYEALGTDAAPDCVALGVSWRSDERQHDAWQPMFTDGRSSWDLGCLYVTADGLEVRV